MKKVLYLSLSATLSLLSLWPSKANAQIISTVAGNGIWLAPGCDLYDGSPATSVSFATELPSLVVDASGNIIACDMECSSIRKINTAGILSTIVGAMGRGVMGDGGPATAAAVDWPHYIIKDGAGNLYFTEDGQDVRKINTAGIISLVGGDGSSPGPVNDGGMATATYIGSPQGLAIDGGGNIYVCDYTYGRVRKIDPAGIITTFAGSGAPGHTSGYSGDGGPATAAKFNDPIAVAIDASGNTYIADMISHVIRKVNTSGIISTIAGNGTQGFAGDGGPATAALLNYPSDLKFDSHGNLFIADKGNERIRVINTSGIISTYAGCGLSGFSGDGGAATAAKLASPTGIAFDAAGNLYIADDSNSAVRKVVPNTALSIGQATATTQKFSLFPNPNTGSFTLQSNLSTSANNNLTFEVTNLLGQVVYKNTLETNAGNISQQIKVDGIPNGVYLLRINGEGENDVLRFTIEK
jgi:type IX secretion system substrate protein